MEDETDSGEYWTVFPKDVGGDVSGREVDDVEGRREIGGAEELGLGGGGLGGDVEEADVEAVVSGQALRELEEGDDVAHSGTREDCHVGFRRF